MRFVGVDGCRYGWLSVALSRRGSWAIAMDRTIRDVLDRWREAEHIFVDIPIGLTDGGDERACDLAARRVLSGRTSSVFPAPTRQAVYASSYEEASRLNRECCGRGLSKQSWAIAAKIRETDELMRTDPVARQIVREVHPEVLFWGLTGSPMQANKKSEEGREERLSILERVLAHAREVFQPKLFARDDVIDALAAAVVARLERFRTLPLQAERDSEGLPMEMVYSGPEA